MRMKVEDANLSDKDAQLTAVGVAEIGIESEKTADDNDEKELKAELDEDAAKEISEKASDESEHSSAYSTFASSLFSGLSSVTKQMSSQLANSKEMISTSGLNAENAWKLLDNAKHLTQNLEKYVEEKTIVGDFNRVHKDFVDSQEKAAAAGAISLAEGESWLSLMHSDKLSCEEYEYLKSDISKLADSERNFIRAPPEGAKFEFIHLFPILGEGEQGADYMKIAQYCLEEDSKLKEIRYQLVPKKVSEEQFWRSFFYRVWLIKQAFDKLPVEDRKIKAIPASTEHTESATEETEEADDNWEEELNQELEDFEMVDGDNSEEALSDLEKEG